MPLLTECDLSVSAESVWMCLPESLDVSAEPRVDVSAESLWMCLC